MNDKIPQNIISYVEYSGRNKVCKFSIEKNKIIIHNPQKKEIGFTIVFSLFNPWKKHIMQIQIVTKA